MENNKPKFAEIIKGAESLSLGISMVVAILIGVGIGIALKNMFGATWLLFVGVFIGVAAAGLNVFKAYEKQMRELDELKDAKRYPGYKDDDEDDKY
jgi:F0F1-type ATP synthase assembly protein I